MSSSSDLAGPLPRDGLIAALASAIVPGWGQVYAGEKTRGSRLLIVDGSLVVLAVALLLWLRLDMLKLWVSSSGLALMMAINLVLLGYRWLAATDAYQSVSEQQPPRLQANVLMVVVALVLVAPHFGFGYLAVTQYGLIDSVFGAPSPSAGPVVTTTTVPGASTTLLVGSTVATSDSRPVLWDGLERLNIALLGADAGEGRSGLRTDTTIVVSIDPETGDVAMFSVPRDLSNAPLPAGMGIWDCNCFPDIFTHLYRAAEDNPAGFPGQDNPGINAVKAALGELFGIPIHHYALVTLDGFVDIVDALGGVTIDVPVTIVDEEYPHEDGSVQSITIEAGTQHLDGHQALAYARIRRQSNDFARMHRQRCVIEAVIEQSAPTEILLRFGAIAEALKRSLVTDIPEERLADFIDLLPKVETERIASLRITRDEYQIGAEPGRVFYDVERIRADAQAMMEDPESAIAALGLGSLDESCGGGDESPGSGL